MIPAPRRRVISVIQGKVGASYNQVTVSYILALYFKQNMTPVALADDVHFTRTVNKIVNTTCHLTQKQERK